MLMEVARSMFHLCGRNGRFVDALGRLRGQVNGEIYNHEHLRSLMPDHKYNTQSDCEVIAHLVRS